MAVFTGVRNFISALKVGLDNAVNYFLDQYGIQLGAMNLLQERAPNLPDVEAQRVIDYTVRTRAFGERINRLAENTRLATGRAPVNPAYSGRPVYWTEVEVIDPATRVVNRRLVIVNADPNETRRQVEDRIRQLARSNWEESPKFRGKGNPVEAEYGRVHWLRGYSGVE